ncbi:SUMO-activating enzyme subunit [Dirofilaria immitis]
MQSMKMRMLFMTGKNDCKVWKHKLCEGENEVEINMKIYPSQRFYHVYLIMNFIHGKKWILPKSYFSVQVMLRLQDSGDAVDQEKFIELWKRELEQCNHILDDEYFNIKYFSHFVGPQLSLACAIVGAHMAQEAIKVLSQKDDPLRNVFFYSAIDTSGIVCYLPLMI